MHCKVTMQPVKQMSREPRMSGVSRAWPRIKLSSLTKVLCNCDNDSSMILASEETSSQILEASLNLLAMSPSLLTVTKQAPQRLITPVAIESGSMMVGF
jgi:hypothetical protein